MPSTICGATAAINMSMPPDRLQRKRGYGHGCSPPLSLSTAEHASDNATESSRHLTRHWNAGVPRLFQPGLSHSILQPPLLHHHPQHRHHNRPKQTTYPESSGRSAPDAVGCSQQETHDTHVSQESANGHLYNQTLGPARGVSTTSPADTAHTQNALVSASGYQKESDPEDDNEQDSTHDHHDYQQQQTHPQAYGLARTTPNSKQANTISQTPPRR